MPRRVLDLSAAAILEALSSERRESAGVAAALTAAMAAALTVKAARASLGSWTEAGAAAAQARVLQGRLAPLADENATAYERALDALESAARDERTPDLAGALDRAAAVPGRVAALAGSVAELSAHVAEHAVAEVRADVAAASALAAAAARAAGHLVEVNLTVRSGDPRLETAAEAAALAERSAVRALASTE
jgi:formiminotetrahydrofolate cyclodeaminase